MPLDSRGRRRPREKGPGGGIRFPGQVARREDLSREPFRLRRRRRAGRHRRCSIAAARPVPCRGVPCEHTVGQVRRRSALSRHVPSRPRQHPVQLAAGILSRPGFRFCIFDREPQLSAALPPIVTSSMPTILRRTMSGQISFVSMCCNARAVLRCKAGSQEVLPTPAAVAPALAQQCGGGSRCR